MKILKQVINASSAEFYYQWGDEPTGYVTFGRYDKNDVLVILGVGPREWIDLLGLKFHNPHS